MSKNFQYTLLWDFLLSECCYYFMCCKYSLFTTLTSPLQNAFIDGNTGNGWHVSGRSYLCNFCFASFPWWAGFFLCYSPSASFYIFIDFLMEVKCFYEGCAAWQKHLRQITLALKPILCYCWFISLLVRSYHFH